MKKVTQIDASKYLDEEELETYNTLQAKIEKAIKKESLQAQIAALQAQLEETEE